jgi:hypothetical protein
MIAVKVSSDPDVMAGKSASQGAPPLDRTGARKPAEKPELDPRTTK